MFSWISLIRALPGVVLLWAPVTALGMDAGAIPEGEFSAPDRCFRVVLYETQGKAGLLFYGCLARDGVVYHYLARAKRLRREGDTLHFELPPRRFSKVKNTTAGIAGHQSELPPEEAADVSTAWRLEIVPDSAQLECAMETPAVCGLNGTIGLRRIR